LKKSVDGEEAVKEIEKSKRSDGGVAANGAKRESERAHLSLPLLVARVQWLVVGRTQLSLQRRSAHLKTSKSPMLSKKCSTGQQYSERANVRVKASQDKAKQSKGGAKFSL